MRIDGVPVDVFLHPVFRFVLTEQIGQRVHLRLARDDEQAVAFAHFGRSAGHEHLAFAPQSRHHKTGVFGMRHDVVDGVPKQGGIAHAVGGDVGFFVVVVLFGVVVTLQPTAHDDQHNDDADHADGIGHRTAQGGHGRRLAELLERLLCRTQRGGIGRGTAEHAHQIGEGHPTRQGDHHGQHRADQHHTDAQQIEDGATVTERGDKTGTDMQTEGIHEENESEALGIGEHLRIEFQPKGAGQNAGKEHERDAEADAAKTKLSQRETEGADGRQDDDGLNGGGTGEEVDKPHVEWNVE